MTNEQILEDAIEPLGNTEQLPVAWMYVNTDGECEEIGHVTHYDKRGQNPFEKNDAEMIALGFEPLYTKRQLDEALTKFAELTKTRAILAGYVLVPILPSKEMINIGINAFYESEAFLVKEMYTAMITAAQQERN